MSRDEKISQVDLTGHLGRAMANALARLVPKKSPAPEKAAPVSPHVQAAPAERPAAAMPRHGLRQAFIWSEVLGKPVSER